MLVFAHVAARFRTSVSTEVTRSYDVLAAQQAIASDLHQLDADDRRVISGEMPSRRRDSHEAEVRADVARIARLTEEDSLQQAHMRRFARAYDQRIALSVQVCDIARRGDRIDARQRLATIGAQEINLAMFGALAAARTRETVLQQEALACWNRWTQVADLALAFVSLLGLGLLVSAGRELYISRRLREKAERKEHAAYEKIADILASITDGFLAVDHDWNVTYANAVVQQFARANGAPVGSHFWSLRRGEPSATFERNLRHSMKARVPVRFEDFSEFDGKWLQVSAYPTKDGLSLYVQDITEAKRLARELKERSKLLERANRRLKEWATIDALTGLANRRTFEHRIDLEVAQARRSSSACSLLMLDIDKFKTYNDTHGHPAGDEALRQVAACLQAGVRHGDLVARFGGEEMVVVLPHTPMGIAMEVAERIRAMVEDHPWPLRRVTVSIGVATLDPEMDGPADLLEAADRALYASKSGGRNRCTSADLVPLVAAA